MRIDRAIDLFLGELARRGYSPRTRGDYYRKLVPLCEFGEVDPLDVSEISSNHCRLHLDRWRERAPGTRYHSWAVLRSFFGWLYQAGEIDVNPMGRIEAPKRLRPDELDVTTVTGADVRKLFDACTGWDELVCLSTLAYLGPRRKAAAILRWRDVDLERGRVRFREKGGKVIHKPLPREYAAILCAARAATGAGLDEYVIPMARRQRRAGERDDRVVYRIVKRVGKRAGVKVHSHALRAAFAVQFLETHPGELEALRRLLGHSKHETTQIYLRRLDRERSMEAVQDLSWGLRFGAPGEEAPSGFEPLYGALQAPA
jgi:integrase